MSRTTWDVIVVGGGILGLSTAMEITRRHPEKRVLVLEKEADVGRHQSLHNSGVIHAGLYYRPGSLKAKTCVEGAAAMVRFAQEHGIDHEICGKVVVATNEAEIPRLRRTTPPGRGQRHREHRGSGTRGTERDRTPRPGRQGPPGALHGHHRLWRRRARLRPHHHSGRTEDPDLGASHRNQHLKRRKARRDDGGGFCAENSSSTARGFTPIESPSSRAVRRR